MAMRIQDGPGHHIPLHCPFLILLRILHWINAAHCGDCISVIITMRRGRELECISLLKLFNPSKLETGQNIEFAE